MNIETPYGKLSDRTHSTRARETVLNIGWSCQKRKKKKKKKKKRKKNARQKSHRGPYLCRWRKILLFRAGEIEEEKGKNKQIATLLRVKIKTAREMSHPVGISFFFFFFFKHSPSARDPIQKLSVKKIGRVSLIRDGIFHQEILSHYSLCHFNIDVLNSICPCHFPNRVMCNLIM